MCSTTAPPSAETTVAPIEPAGAIHCKRMTLISKSSGSFAAINENSERANEQIEEEEKTETETKRAEIQCRFSAHK